MQFPVSPRLVVSALALPALLAASAAVTQPPPRSHGKSQASFDCARAATRVEKLICSDNAIAAYDRELGLSYARALRHAPASERPAVLARQRAWLRKRDACADEKCVTDLYMARQESLYAEVDRYDRLLRRGVARIGQCQVTTIENIGGRISERPEESGTSVGMANGVSLVSYDLERPVVASRIGDPVRVCLASIPQGCPPGDDRGREYRVTNLRTGGHWRMPDSEHECGGA